MMLKFRSLFFVMLMGICFSTVHAQENFVLEGTVIQGTADGTPLAADLPLRLQIISVEGAERHTFDTTADSAGKFSFASVPRYDDGSLYVVSTQWAGIQQTSIPMTFAEITPPFEFRVYEITSDLSNVVANRGNLRIEFTDVNQLGVQMLLELNYANLGDRIVLANPGTTQATAFTVELPVGAFGVAPEEAPGLVQRFVPIETINGLPIPGIRDTQPLVPELPNVMRVSFLVPYEDGAVIDMRFPFALADLALFVREDTVSIESDLLTLSTQTETSSGRVYYIYEQTTDLQPNAPFKFSILGEPTQTVRVPTVTTTTSEGDSSTAVVIVILLAALLVFFSVVIWVLRARLSQSSPQ